MTKLTFGNATISAKRAGPITYLEATGSCKEAGETYDFLQLPFFIFPPRWGFMIKSVGSSHLKAGDSFTYSEFVPYPRDVDFVVVQTETGLQHVKIEEVPFNLVPYKGEGTTVVGEFSVFNRINTTEYLIAKDDAILPAIYRKVFGPASYDDCEKYVKDHEGK